MWQIVSIPWIRKDVSNWKASYVDGWASCELLRIENLCILQSCIPCRYGCISRYYELVLYKVMWRNWTRERHTNSSANPTPVVPNPSSSPLIISLTPSYSKPICWQRSCQEWDPTVHTGIHASPCWKRAMRILTDSDFRCDQFCR